MSILGWIIAGAIAVYLLIGGAHASAISSDSFLTPGQFWSLVFGWPWKGTSWL